MVKYKCAYAITENPEYKKYVTFKSKVDFNAVKDDSPGGDALSPLPNTQKIKFLTLNHQEQTNSE